MARTVQTLPPKYYTDPSEFNRVKERIFYRTWQFACHTSRIPSPGDYLAFSVGDQDLFVVRDSNQEIRCFYNVCQHRAHGLVTGRGQKKLLVCPYHAWSYTLDGKLKAATGAQAHANFDTSAICLTQVKVDSLCGFIFVNLDPQAATLNSSFPGLAAAITTHCPDINEQVFAHEFETVESCNWLVAVENYNECYHCKNVHQSFSSGIVDPKSYDIGVLGDTQCLHHSAKAQSGNTAWYDTSGSDYASFFVWPTFSLQIYPSGLVNTYHWCPLSVDRTHIYRQFYSQDGRIGFDLQNVIDLDHDTTFAEDLELVKSVQRGLGSKGYQGGPLVVNPAGGINSEHSIVALHNWFRDALV